MKATGIIRRIDELGRIVIPKELRRTLHIKEGDPIEIFTVDDGVIALRKYEPADSVLSYLERLEELINDEEFRHKSKMLAKVAELEALLTLAAINEAIELLKWLDERERRHKCE